METVVTNGITYTKASVLAKQFRYTPDYIGQLCRAGKIDCQLVGRSWFVSEAALLEHKDTRYKEIRLDEKTNQYNTKSATVGETIAVHPRLSRVTAKNMQPKTHNFENRLGAFSSRYFNDEDDLQPQPLRRIKPIIPTSVPVAFAEAVSLKVIEHEPAAALTFTELPSVPLSGRLQVENIEYATLDDAVAPVTLQDLSEHSPSLNHITTSVEPVALPKKRTPPAVGRTHNHSLPVKLPAVQFVPATVVMASEQRQTHHAGLLLMTAVCTSVALVGFLLMSSELLTIVGGTMVSTVDISPASLMTIWLDLEAKL
jgi:hypothetical protein